MVSPITIEDVRTLGPYRLLRPLGEHVSLAERPGGEPVAVQAVPAEAAADPRFPGQVAAARTLNADRVAPVVDTDLDTTSLVGASLVGASLDDASPAEGAGVGTALEADGPWLASAYIAGPSLAELVLKQGPLPGPAALELAARLAEGLREMHAAGVVHGNLKPSNVVLAPDGPRLTGYGIWNVAEVPGQDPGFLSPEQILGQDTGAPGDIFSLGAVLAFAAGGRGPFGSGSAAALMYRLVNSPAQLDQLDADVRAVAERGLAKEPADRPTAAELVAGLEDLRPLGEWQELALSVAVLAPRQPAAKAQPDVAAGPDKAGALAGAGAGMAGAWRAFSSGNGRNGGWRSLAPVWITGSVLAVLAAVVLLATGIVFPGRSGQAEPQAGAVVAATGSQQAPAGNSAAGASSAPASAPGQAKLTRMGGSASSSPLILGGSSASVFVSLPAARAAAPAVVAAAKAGPAGTKSAGAAKSAGPATSTGPAKSSAPASKPPSSAPSGSPSATASPSASSGPSASPSGPAPSTSAPASSAPASSPPVTSSAGPSATASASGSAAAS